MTDQPIRDVSTDLEAVESGTDDQGDPVYDLAPVEGEELVSQRLERVYFLAPGGIPHRPELGADLEAQQSEPPTPTRQQRILNRIDRALATFPLVEDHRVLVEPVDGKPSATKITTEAKVDGTQTKVSEVTIGN